MKTHYANNREVSETPTEASYKEGPLDLRDAFRAGADSQSRHWQEEIPGHLLGLVNRVRAIACAPGAQYRSAESILNQALTEFCDHSLEYGAA